MLLKVIIKSVLTYASETWTLTITKEKALTIFKRKFLRTIFGAALENSTWRKRYKFEIYKIYKDGSWMRILPN